MRVGENPDGKKMLIYIYIGVVGLECDEKISDKEWKDAIWKAAMERQ